MSRQWRFVCVLSAILLVAASSWAANPDAKGDVAMAADSIKWENGPAPGTHVAKLWGDWMKSGPYGVLVKFDAGTINPMHHHTQDLKIVVLSGTFTHQPEGGAVMKFGPGSYLMQAGGTNHISGCDASGPCEFFMTSADTFDMVPAAAAAAK